MSDPSVVTGTTTSPTPPPVAGSSSGPGIESEPERGSRVRRIVLVIFLVLVVAGIALLIAFFQAARHWFALHTGTLHGGPDVYYNFWSGFGSDLGEATLISAVGIGVYTAVRKVNCHTKGCWRIGHHPLEGTPYILCRHHHPGVPTKGATHQHILEQHRKFKEAQAAREAAGT
ncbi:MAG TPA: hypothetical protein VGG43_12305 [Acidimicrobiales bacterium]|jgi:hypothetical protein